MEVHWTTDPLRKFAPAMAIGNEPIPAADFTGVTVVMAGLRIENVAELETLLPTWTAMVAVAPAVKSAVGMNAWSWLVETNVVVKLWTVGPLVNTTVASDVKLAPVREIEKPGLPAEAVAGDTVVRLTFPMVKN